MRVRACRCVIYSKFSTFSVCSARKLQCQRYTTMTVVFPNANDIRTALKTWQRLSCFFCNLSFIFLVMLFWGWGGGQKEVGFFEYACRVLCVFFPLRAVLLCVIYPFPVLSLVNKYCVMHPLLYLRVCGCGFMLSSTFAVALKYYSRTTGLNNSHERFSYQRTLVSLVFKLSVSFSPKYDFHLLLKKKILKYLGIFQKKTSSL